jgi:hypothetical protein
LTIDPVRDSEIEGYIKSEILTHPMCKPLEKSVASIFQKVRKVEFEEKLSGEVVQRDSNEVGVIGICRAHLAIDGDRFSV